MSKILEYQEFDRQLRQIEKQLAESPDRKEFRKYSGFLNDAQTALKKMELRSRELNTLLDMAAKALGEKQELIDEYARSVEECMDSQETDFLIKKVSEVSSAMAQTERDIRNIIRETEEIASRYDSFRAKVPTAQKRAKEAKTRFDALRATRQEEVDALRGKLQALEAEIDATLIGEYKNLKSQGVFPPIAELRGKNQCGGCGVELSMMKVETLSQKGRIRCEHCNRIIYKD